MEVSLTLQETEAAATIEMEAAAVIEPEVAEALIRTIKVS